MKELRDAAETLGISVDDSHLALFQKYYETLLAWNRQVNLTRITEPSDVAIRHFLDSLSCLLVFPTPTPHQGWQIVDIGTGAGFPGLPLKIVRPDLHVTLIETTGKKVAFLEHIVRELGLRDVQVLKGRAEDVAHEPAHREQYDVALTRAVAALPTLAEYSLPFLRPGGRMIAAKTADIALELRESLPAISLLGGQLAETRTVHLPSLTTARLLVVVDKISASPAQYPRRAGLPAKKPLGA